MKRKLLRPLAAFALLLAPLGAAGAQEQGAGTLTPEERREAGEFLLRLDERWRETRDFNALFDDTFVADYLEVSREKGDAFPLLFVEESLRAQLTPADLRRAHVVGIDLTYVAGRLCRAFELREKGRREAERTAAPPRAAGGDEAPPAGQEEGDSESSIEEMLSPPVVEVFKSNPLAASAILEDGRGEKTGGGGEGRVRTFWEFDGLLSVFERAIPKMRGRVRELEAELPGAPLSAVAREDEDEGEWPDLELVALDTEWRNRPAGTRVVCGYVSNLHVDLVKEGGRYRVLAAYVED